MKKYLFIVFVFFILGWCSIYAFAGAVGLTPQQASMIYVSKPAFNSETGILRHEMHTQAAFSSYSTNHPYQQYILVEDQQPMGTGDGAFTSGAWYTRVLNTIVQDDTGSVVLNGYSTVSVPAGTYRFRASAPAMGVDAHRCSLQTLNAEFSDYSTIAYGTSERAAG
ncbi:MAG: hypothetical protein ACYDFU_09470, partial [Nitrospirota bacterium]